MFAGTFAYAVILPQSPTAQLGEDITLTYFTEAPVFGWFINEMNVAYFDAEKVDTTVDEKQMSKLTFTTTPETDNASIVCWSIIPPDSLYSDTVFLTVFGKPSVS